MADVESMIAFGYPIMDVYYLLNMIWVYGNIIMIPLCFFPMIVRYLKPEFPKHLWTDHFPRACLIFGTFFSGGLRVFDWEARRQFAVEAGESFGGGPQLCMRPFRVLERCFHGVAAPQAHLPTARPARASSPLHTACAAP